jgi:hypothetical protein
MAGALAGRPAGVETLSARRPGSAAAADDIILNNRASESTGVDCPPFSLAPTKGASMSYDIQILFQATMASVAAPGTIAQRMHKLIDACERRLPHPDWAHIRRIDFDADAAALRKWLAEAWSEGALHEGHQGLWFGIVNPVVDDEPLTDIYLASSPSYDDDDVEWNGGIDLRDGVSFLGSAVLADLYRIAYRSKGGLGNDAEYPLALAYGAMAAYSALAQHTLAPELGALRGAAAGFDSGDALFIGVFDNLRFIRRVREG